MMDGFFGYNQVFIHHEDKKKIAFTTPWGMFMYAKMPFCLINIGATFQRVMVITSFGKHDKFVVIYLHDVIIF